ncbi:MAG: prephenate dehydrogenase [bacterium]|nr:prephenate dehydrogenase [bacterium]
MNICIIGFGRFGKLAAKIFAPYGQIFIIANKKVNCRHKVTTLQKLPEMDWIILAVPISKLESLIKNISNKLKPGAVIMDVASVKVYPCEWLRKHLPADVNILGTHPMFGPDSAKFGLRNLQIVLCPIAIDKKMLSKVKAVFRSLGLKIIITTPSDHDRQAASSLALVHFIGRALSAANIKDQKIKTPGFDRMLAINDHVSKDTWQLFTDMIQYNPYARTEISKFVRAIQSVKNKVL